LAPRMFRSRLGSALPRRLSAAAVAVFLIAAATAPGVSAHQAGVTFSAQPGVATLVAHYAVAPADRGGSTVAVSLGHANLNDQLPDLAPKSPGRTAASRVGLAPSHTGVQPSGSSAADRTPRAIASFIGQQASNVTCSYFARGCNPPDMAIAASPRRVLQGVNTQWEVLDTAGHVQPGWPTSAAAFFGVPSSTTCDAGAGGQPFLSDPRALYDPSTGRFWAAMLQVEGALGVGVDCPFKTVYYVAVSQTHDPSGTWNVYEFDMSLGTTNAADFTQIGLDGNAVYFSANMFDPTLSYAYAEIFEANKHQMEAGGGAFTADGFINLQAHGPGGAFLADTVQPALNLDGSGPGVFVDTFDGPDPITGNFCSSPTDACRGLAVWRLGNPTGHDHGGPAPTLTGSRVDTKPFIFSPPADEPGCTQCIDASDLRISATPIERDGVISAAWETGTGANGLVPGIEWAQFSADDGHHGSDASSGYYVSPTGAAVTYPALVPGDHGRLTMVFERMSSTVNPESRFIVKSDAWGQFSGDGRLLKAGEAPYRPGICQAVTFVCRWGDYSAASFDGANRIWIAGEYANPFTDPASPPVFGRNWGTWIGALGTDR
jgi:hypothetical protein